MILRRYFTFICACAFVCNAMAQVFSQHYHKYIEQYKMLAVEQMLRHKIPASITLAQGILESGAGTSTLATEANNHFGIKCHSDWTGPYVLRDDDARNERFRKYNNARESFEDHSLFLKRPRYTSLFKLKITDYKGWAHGLKRCGYATNPRYATLLIDLIERFELHQYDKYKKSDIKAEQSVTDTDGVMHDVYFNNDNYYIIAKSGDTFKSLAEEMGVSARSIRRYNELPKGYVIQQGDILYLEKKRKRAERKYKNTPHIVSEGESMYLIAQKYGIRLKSLYNMNDLTPDYAIKSGDALRVR